MNATEECHSIQLLTRDGNLNTGDLEKFMDNAKFSDWDYDYNIVSIIGPQSSGKSTLLNNLFQTNFKAMNPDMGLSQTTQGIWMEKCNSYKPFTIVMDAEGADGRERKEDTTFEKQSALFAFAVSDVVMINMNWTDFGKMHGGCRHLLKTVFQHMAQYFDPRKTTLLFVLRDKDNLDSKFEGEVKDDITKIWDEAVKGTAHQKKPISDYFNVKATSLAYYKTEEFKIQVEELREQFSKLTQRGRAMVPASGFSFSMQKIWKIIQDDRYLQLPAHGGILVNFLFTRTANELLSSFSLDERWVALQKVSQTDSVQGFVERVSSIRDEYLEKYDKNTGCTDGETKTEIRKKLESDISKKLLLQLRSIILDKYKNEIDSAIESAEDPITTANSLAQSCVKHFDKLCEGFAKDKTITSEMRVGLGNDIKLYAVSQGAAVKAKCHNETQPRLNDLRNTIYKKCKNKIDGLLETAEDPNDTVEELIQYYVSKFDESLKGDVRSIKDGSLVSQTRLGLENDMKLYAISRLSHADVKHHEESKKFLTELCRKISSKIRKLLDDFLNGVSVAVTNINSFIDHYLLFFDELYKDIPDKERSFVSEMLMGLVNEVKLFFLSCFGELKHSGTQMTKIIKMAVTILFAIIRMAAVAIGSVLDIFYMLNSWVDLLC